MKLIRSSRPTGRCLAHISRLPDHQHRCLLLPNLNKNPLLFCQVGYIKRRSCSWKTEFVVLCIHGCWENKLCSKEYIIATHLSLMVCLWEQIIFDFSGKKKWYSMKMSRRKYCLCWFRVSFGEGDCRPFVFMNTYIYFFFYLVSSAGD